MCRIFLQDSSTIAAMDGGSCPRLPAEAIQQPALARMRTERRQAMALQTGAPARQRPRHRPRHPVRDIARDDPSAPAPDAALPAPADMQEVQSWQDNGRTAQPPVARWTGVVRPIRCRGPNRLSRPSGPAPRDGSSTAPNAPDAADAGALLPTGPGVSGNRRDPEPAQAQRRPARSFSRKPAPGGPVRRRGRAVARGDLSRMASRPRPTPITRPDPYCTIRGCGPLGR